MGSRRRLTDAQWEELALLLPKLSSRGRPWRNLPWQYPSPSTCWRGLRLWEEQGLWLEIWRSFLAQLDSQEKLDWSESFLDGQGVPLGGRLDSASPAGVKLAEATLATISVPRAGPGRPKNRPQRVIADKAYDCENLRQRLKRRGIELICPHLPSLARSPRSRHPNLSRLLPPRLPLCDLEDLMKPALEPIS